MLTKITPKKILLVEDNQSLSENISELLKISGYDVIGIYDSAEEAKDIMIESPPDVALIDIKLRGPKTGIDLATELRSELHLPLIFITSASGKEVVDRVKHIKPEGFIVKPFTKESLITTIELALENFKNQAPPPSTTLSTHESLANEFFIRENGWLKKIKFSDILWLKAEGTYTQIFANGKQFTLRNTAKEVLSKLPEGQFKRVHKSFIINLHKVEAFNSNTVKIENEEIPIGRNYYHELINLVNKISG